MQAVAGPTTRRALFGAAIPAVAATALLASQPEIFLGDGITYYPSNADEKSGWVAFAAALGALHPNGRRVAGRAMMADAKLSDLYMVLLWGAGDRQAREDEFPVLLFSPPGASPVRISPTGTW